MAMPNSTPPERMLTVPEVAAAMRVNAETVRRWLRTGELRGFQTGRKAGWRIRERDLHAFIETHGNTSGQEGKIKPLP